MRFAMIILSLGRSTKDRIRYLLAWVLSLLTKPIDKAVCRAQGHGNIWVVDGWPNPNTRIVVCSRCGESKVFEKDAELPPRFYVYDPKTRVIVRVEPLPSPLYRRVRTP